MAGVDAFGTQFKRSDMATPTSAFTAIANVSNISGPSRSRETIDTTTHDSPDKYREFIKGLKDAGEVTITIHYDPADTGHSNLDSDFEEDEARDYQVVMLPGTAAERTWDFSGLVTSIGDEFPIDDKMEREVTFKISGKPELTVTGV